MTKREFNKWLNACRTKNKKSVDTEKLAALPEETKTAMAYYVIRYRGPLLLELLTPAIDQKWLASMGYLYRTKGQQYTFIHTCEHAIK